MREKDDRLVKLIFAAAAQNNAVESLKPLVENQALENFEDDPDHQDKMADIMGAHHAARTAAQLLSYVNHPGAEEAADSAKKIADELYNQGHEYFKQHVPTASPQDWQRHYAGHISGNNEGLRDAIKDGQYDETEE